MKIIRICSLSLLVLFTTHAFTQEKQGNSMFKTSSDSLSYCFGLLIGNNIQAQGVNKISPEILMNGLNDGFGGIPPLISFEEANAYIQAYFAKSAQLKADENIRKGKAFLEENGKKEGVITLPSGLQYKVLQAGEGRSPKQEEKVKVHYTGSLINGTVFDSSVERGEPAVFQVNQVISGWVEALQLMKTGSKWMLYLPSELAYGPNGAGDVIGPNEVLIFEVELLEILAE